MERRTYTVTEAATVLGISRTSTYELIRACELPALRLGRRIVTTRAVVDEMLGAAPLASEETSDTAPRAS